jgi:hypothetical protein
MNKTTINLLMAMGLLGTPMMAGFITNGSFETATYTASSEVGPNYTGGTTAANGQGITGWTVGGTGGGYGIYFFAGNASTVSALNQWGSNSEMIPANYTSAPGYTADPDGGQFVALDGDPTIATTISQAISGLTIGQWYNVSFFWAGTELQSRTGATTESVQVTLGTGSQTTKVVNTVAQGFNGWYAQTFSYKATATNETLTFMAVGTPAGLPPLVLLDGVSMFSTPEPTSLAMLGLGIALFGVARLRRPVRK